MSNPVKVLMCGNKNYLNAITIATLSMSQKDFAREDGVEVYFLTMDLTDINPKFNAFDEPSRQFCESILRRANPANSFKLFDCTEIFRTSGLINSVNLKTHFTPYVMLRLLADLVDLPDRIVYLDGDVIINGDLRELYNYPMPDGCELGAVQDLFQPRGYFNAGIILFDMVQCRKTKLFEKARNFVIKRRMMYVDQDALNKAVTNKIMLPLKFNAKDKYFPEIVVHHFCNVRRHIFHRVKPWEVEFVKQKMTVYNDLLDEYCTMIPEIESIKHS